MSKFFKKLADHKIVRTLSSLKIAVIGLLLLFILTFWGTVAQVENGLYASQERYFGSFYFLAMGFLPFPGGQAVLWVLFVNLACALLDPRFYRVKMLGYLIIHLGLVLFLISAFVIFIQAKESHLTLREGEASNVSVSYFDWEVALWTKNDATKSVTAIDLATLSPGQDLIFENQQLRFQVKEFYKNCHGYSGPENPKILNASGIKSLKEVPLDKQAEKNVPGLILGSANVEIMLMGGEEQPTRVKVGEKEYHLILRHKRYLLPLVVKLVDFMMEKHPGTEMARSYKSRVEITHDKVSREAIISMNEPLRFKEYTLYQSSYQIDSMGRESSTLAVVRNYGQLLPYIATFVTFFGLALHFLLAAFGVVNLKKHEK